MCKVVEVRNHDAGRRYTPIQCESQPEDMIAASPALPVSMPLVTQRDAQDGTSNCEIPYGSKVLVPALLSSLSPMTTEVAAGFVGVLIFQSIHEGSKAKKKINVILVFGLFVFVFNFDLKLKF